MAQYECENDACGWIGEHRDPNMDGELACPACGSDAREVREYTLAEQEAILRRARDLLKRHGR